MAEAKGEARDNMENKAVVASGALSSFSTTTPKGHAMTSDLFRTSRSFNNGIGATPYNRETEEIRHRQGSDLKELNGVPRIGSGVGGRPFENYHVDYKLFRGCRCALRARPLASPNLHFTTRP